MRNMFAPDSDQSPRPLCGQLLNRASERSAGIAKAARVRYQRFDQCEAVKRVPKGNPGNSFC